MKKRHDMISEVMLVQNLDSMILKAWKGEISELRQRSRMIASPVRGWPVNGGSGSGMETDDNWAAIADLISVILLTK